MRSIAATLFVAILVPATGYAKASQPASPGWQRHAVVAFDALFLRPLNVLALITGGVFVVPVALLTWPTGRETTDEAVERFVTIPAKDLFERPLGEI